VRAGGHDASRVRGAISGEPPVVVERDAAPRVRRSRPMSRARESGLMLSPRASFASRAVVRAREARFDGRLA